MSSGTDEGVTSSIRVKDGRRSTVVGADGDWSCSWFTGIGMLEAESISLPFVGPFPYFPTASITLPFSSSMSLTQSVLPVATSMCVAHPLMWPYSLSSSSTLKFEGYLIEHDSQS